MSFKDDFYEGATVTNAQFSDVETKRKKKRGHKNKKNEKFYLTIKNL